MLVGPSGHDSSRLPLKLEKNYGPVLVMKTESKSILKEGRNCWRNAQADRIALLFDGAAYFEALADAIEQAQKTIYIAGWDFNSRISLSRRSGNSVSLGELRNQKVSRTPNLRAYVLV